jgi:endonuclease YncB( thermonuclease family)
VKRTSSAVALALLAAACNGTAAPTVPVGTEAVVAVLDGDSLVVELGGEETEVRLLGINTPERDECFDQEAKARARELAGDRVRLSGEDEDRFGRLLGYAYTEAGTLINQQLVAEGMALALSTDHALLDDFKAAEQYAFDQRLGRWQPDACGPASTAALVIDELTYDAPGDDSRNSNGEWIDIHNDGSEPASLRGWSIQDESSSHRFPFPDDFRLEAGDRVRISSGCGTPSDDHLFWGECDGDAVWSNGGDTAYLLDASGNVVDRFAF